MGALDIVERVYVGMLTGAVEFEVFLEIGVA
jgi:hypothetical protein